MNINWTYRELNLKIVYYGPARSGKTTNLQWIHARVDPRHRSQLVSLKTDGDRTLFFDFLQIELSKINGLQPKLHLYTVPGQSYYEASRRLVLRGVDGVVFVADSTPDCLETNRASWLDLGKHLTANGLSLESTPVVVQCNKQDAVGAVSPESVRQALSLSRFPLQGAVAIRGEGVLDTLKAISAAVITCVRQEVA